MCVRKRVELLRWKRVQAECQDFLAGGEVFCKGGNALLCVADVCKRMKACVQWLRALAMRQALPLVHQVERSATRKRTDSRRGHASIGGPAGVPKAAKQSMSLVSSESVHPFILARVVLSTGFAH